jgi:hypothetical protein
MGVPAGAPEHVVERHLDFPPSPSAADALDFRQAVALSTQKLLPSWNGVPASCPSHDLAAGS